MRGRKGMGEGVVLLKIQKERENRPIMGLEKEKDPAHIIPFDPVVLLNRARARLKRGINRPNEK